MTPVRSSPLVVFFPTILQTNLGFLVQGPYRTTPSRDNVPANDPWNKYLVTETSALLVEALQELRGLGLLNVDALRSLPLDASRSPEGSMFAPLFTAVREAFSILPLLPRFGGGHLAAKQAKLARTQELRELFSPPQLSSLFQVDQELGWVSEDITQDRTPELRRYLIDELDIVEMIPESMLARLTKSFLEAQTDEWIVRLYEFLHGQPSLLRSGRLNDSPVIRLENGSHVTPRKDGEPQAFLPGPVPTGFPTVRPSVCRSEEALVFLKSLGLSQPDPIDDVITNVLPKYQQNDVQVSASQYQADIERFLTAFSTDSTAQRSKLIAALKNACFVAVVNTGNGSRCFARPGEAYQATQRLKDLFQGVPDVMIVDDTYDCLRKEKARDLLEACGTALYLQPVETKPSFTWEQKVEMRIKSGTRDITSEVGIQDFTLRGLEPLLATLSQLPPSQAGAKAALLWQALCDVQDRRGASMFSGTYKWHYYHPRQHSFDAAFVRLLNESAWVPDRNGVLQRPELVMFGDIQPPWDSNPFLLSKIRFKPAIIEELAKEAGIEPGVLDLLKKYGLTSEAELKERLGIHEEVTLDNGQTHSEDETEAGKPTSSQSIQPILHRSEEPNTLMSGSKEPGAGSISVPDAGQEPAQKGAPPSKQPQVVQQHGGARKFVSYVAVDVHEEETDPDGLEHQERLELEEKAIALVLSREPQLKRTPTNNPGFDLIQPGPDANPTRWVEVKAMKGTFQDRPVGLSKRQFECAQEHGESYWLYVVESAGSPEHSRVIRVQDPAGKARTFTFDHGWLAVSEIISEVTPPK